MNEKIENNEDKKGNETITIKKNDIWKYSTIFLVAVIAIWIVVSYTRTTGSAINQQGDVDLSNFLNNPSLYPSVGPDNAKVTVIEFFDFQCPFCALVSGLPDFVAQYQTQYGDLIGSEQKLKELAEAGKIKLIYATYSFLGQESIYAGEAALCANEQGKFVEMHDVIFAAHDGEENNGKYNKDKLKILAQGISGLDQKKFAECLDSGKRSSDIQKIAQQSKAAGISGTPSFIVNGVTSSGSWTELSGKLSALGVSVN